MKFWRMTTMISVFSLDETVLNREDQQPKPGEMLLIVDQVLPALRRELKKVPFKTKGILIFDHTEKNSNTIK